MNDPQAPYCLVYLSQATHDFEAEELADLLAVSRRNNASTGITGLLMYESRLFMQALEGPRAEPSHKRPRNFLISTRRRSSALGWIRQAARRFRSTIRALHSG